MSKLQANAVTRAWAKRELPSLDERRCTGCGRCVAICPTECLAMEGALPWLPRPVDCISCALCVFLCPPEALALARLSDGKSSEGA